jgi:hypothetical protein
VHQDPIPGISQDWLVRPVRRQDLLFAKLLFVIATVGVPMLALDLLNAGAAGFTLSQALGPAAVKEIYVLLTLIVPVLALASATENWPQIVIGSAVLMVLFALCLIAASVAIGAERCPTCDTGLRWIQSLLEHAAVLLGAILILYLNYFHRQTSWARWLIAAGLILFALVQVPWSMAFAIQRFFSAAPGDSAPIAIVFDPTAEKAALAPNHRAAVVGAAAVARALLNGNTNAAAEYLRRRALPESAPVAVDLPLQVMGKPNGTLLLVDRSEVRLEADGRVLYHAANGGELAGLDIAQGGGTSHQTIYLPAALYREWAQRPVRLEVTYSLSLLRLSATYTMAATAGELRSGELGRCASQLKNDASEINLRCKQVGLRPPCYTVRLEGPSGQRNAEILDCASDYRPFAAPWPAPMTLFGVDVPVHDNAALVQYPVPSAQLPESRLLVTTYRMRDHFTRTLIAPALILEQWQAQR